MIQEETIKGKPPQAGVYSGHCTQKALGMVQCQPAIHEDKADTYLPATSITHELFESFHIVSLARSPRSVVV
jgi:hypothetical protein